MDIPKQIVGGVNQLPSLSGLAGLTTKANQSWDPNQVDPAVAHELFAIPLTEVPPGCELAYFAMGCYWGAEKLFWNQSGVVNTAVGFAGGQTPNPSYRLVCTGQTGHAETVQVVFDPEKIRYQQLLQIFWEYHDPTQGDRQGNDIGSQYRSVIFTTSANQQQLAEQSLTSYQQALTAHGRGKITTEVTRLTNFYYAHIAHQQYLLKNPDGYDCHQRTGIACPVN